MSSRWITAYERRRWKHLSTLCAMWRLTADTLTDSLPEVKAERVGETLTDVKGSLA